MCCTEKGKGEGGFKERAAPKRVQRDMRSKYMDGRRADKSGERAWKKVAVVSRKAVMTWRKVVNAGDSCVERKNSMLIMTTSVMMMRLRTPLVKSYRFFPHNILFKCKWCVGQLRIKQIACLVHDCLHCCAEIQCQKA